VSTRIESLSLRRDFEELRRCGKRFRGEVVRVVSLQRPDGPVQIAVAASRKSGNAVERNKFRRRVREAARSTTLLPGCYLVIPLAPCREIGFAGIRSDLTKLVAKTCGPGGSACETGVA